MKPRIAVLVSGRGSNLQAIIDAIATGGLNAELVGVLSDQPNCAALQRVPQALRWTASPKRFTDRAAFDRALGDALIPMQPDWIVCAGYMRILGDAFIARFQGRLLNIHPSLLPKYRGLHTHARVLEAGDTEHGASVHFVDPHLDAGALIAQIAIDVRPGDTPDALASRLLAHEHRLLIAVLQLATAGRLYERGHGAYLDGYPLLNPLRLDCSGQWRAQSLPPSLR